MADDPERPPIGSFAEAERFAARIGLRMTPLERLEWLEATIELARQARAAPRTSYEDGAAVGGSASTRGTGR
jgi:hypothetical protein